MSIILAMICYLVPFMVIQAAVKPYAIPMLNYLELGSLVVIILYLLNEMVTTIRIEYTAANYYRTEDGTALSILFVLLPTLAFFFFMIRYLRSQVLSKAFYHSHRLFCLLSCGTKSLNEYAAQKVHDYDKALESRLETEIRQTTTRGNASAQDEIVDPKHVKLNFKRI